MLECHDQNWKRKTEKQNFVKNVIYIVKYSIEIDDPLISRIKLLNKAI